MTELDEAVAKAYANEGKQDDVNKVYLILLRTLLFLPVQKEKLAQDEEPFRPLHAVIENYPFMVVFDTLERLTDWAGEQFEQIDYVEISGRDLIAGMNENVYLVLNAITSYHKEFSPDEIKHLKKIVSRLDNL